MLNFYVVIISWGAFDSIVAKLNAKRNLSFFHESTKLISC